MDAWCHDQYNSGSVRDADRTQENTMLDHVIYLYGFNLMYAEILVKDVSAE